MEPRHIFICCLVIQRTGISAAQSIEPFNPMKHKRVTSLMVVSQEEINGLKLNHSVLNYLEMIRCKGSDSPSSLKEIKRVDKL